jgi:hypothetical protein
VELVEDLVSVVEVEQVDIENLPVLLLDLIQ